MGGDHTRISAREFPTGHRVLRHHQPVIGFRTGIVSPTLRFSAVSITSIVLRPSQRDFLRSTTVRTDGQRAESADQNGRDAHPMAQGQKLEEEVSARRQR